MVLREIESGITKVCNNCHFAKPAVQQDVDSCLYMSGNLVFLTAENQRKEKV